MSDAAEKAVGICERVLLAIPAWPVNIALASIDMAEHRLEEAREGAGEEVRKVLSEYAEKLRSERQRLQSQTADTLRPGAP